MRIDKLEFIDSLQFLSRSLESLGRDFLNSGKTPTYTSEMLGDDIEHNAKKHVVTGKQIFPYEYIDCVDRLSDTSLPPRASFYRSLRDSEISEADYQQAMSMWSALECQTMNDYILYYLHIDVGLLADCFLNWRRLLYSKYGLVIAHFVSLLGYAYQVFSKQTGAQLNYHYDREFYELVLKNIRGGFTNTIAQETQVLNKDIVSPLPDDAESSYVLYLD